MPARKLHGTPAVAGRRRIEMSREAHETAKSPTMFFFSEYAHGQHVRHTCPRPKKHLASKPSRAALGSQTKFIAPNRSHIGGHKQQHLGTVCHAMSCHISAQAPPCASWRAWKIMRMRSMGAVTVLLAWSRSLAASIDPPPPSPLLRGIDPAP